LKQRKRKLVDALKLKKRPNDLIVFQTRLLHKVDSMLRRKMRKHGDMSAFVRESLENVDLRSVELFRFHGKKVLSTSKATQVVMPVGLRKKLQDVAPERGCSMNELLNSAIIAWLTKDRPLRAGARRGHMPTYDGMNPSERDQLWKSMLSLTGLEPGPHSPSREGGIYEWDKHLKSVVETVPSTGKKYVVNSRGGELIRVREIGESPFVERSQSAL
jgi:hypothetical protein